MTLVLLQVYNKLRNRLWLGVAKHSPQSSEPHQMDKSNDQGSLAFQRGTSSHEK